MKNCRICFYSRIFILGICLAVIIVLLNDNLLTVFRGMSPLTISIILISVLGILALIKKVTEYYIKKND
ncbi:MAG: hypothetical protein CMM44_06035 [Rhodospirillaceae bacterium]|nr:hypothetical protein [Rhodospirillaceae bacterium]